MGMDRNTVIGFVLLAGLLFLYLFISTKNSQDLQRKDQADQAHKDSIARVQALKRNDSIARSVHTLNPDSLPSTVQGFQRATFGSEKLETVENDVMRVTFTNKGGQPKSVELKHYVSAEKKPVIMLNSSFDKITYGLNTQANATAQSADFYFTAAPIQTNANGSQTLTFVLNGDNGRTITHQYVISRDSYLINFNLLATGANSLFNQGTVNLRWQNQATRHERDIRYERQQSQIGFLEDESFDYILSKSERKFEKPVRWLSSKQQFFNSTLIAKNNFNSGNVEFTHLPANDTSDVVMQVTADFQVKTSLENSVVIPMQLYYGPNEFRTLKNTATDLDKMVNLGQGFYSFVRPINKWIVMPVFDFFKKFISSYGIVIALLTLFIRLLTSPLVYSSYLSGAKMKALRPEIDKMKLRLTDKNGTVDQQQVGVEQMKLFREAGVNPLGGCIPALLQIPIFFALYSFFSSNIALRGQSFLWAKDLSSYDDVINFGSNVWLIGNHISLFTITAVVTSFLISIYNMNMTPDQNNPALKYMPYIFPFILFFIFNNLPSALTWYYTVSNAITLGLQFVIQNYIIDHDKILARIDEHRKKPRTKPKWQERFEQMQEAQKKAQMPQQRKK